MNARKPRPAARADAHRRGGRSRPRRRATRRSGARGGSSSPLRRARPPPRPSSRRAARGASRAAPRRGAWMLRAAAAVAADRAPGVHGYRYTEVSSTGAGRRPGRPTRSSSASRTGRSRLAGPASPTREGHRRRAHDHWVKPMFARSLTATVRCASSTSRAADPAVPLLATLDANDRDENWATRAADRHPGSLPHHPQRPAAARHRQHHAQAARRALGRARPDARAASRSGRPRPARPRGRGVTLRPCS